MASHDFTSSLPSNGNALEGHAGHDDLADGAHRSTPRWIPVSAAAALLLAGSRSRGILSTLASAAGGAMLYRCLVDRSDEKLQSFARGVRLHSSVWVEASPMECYRAWRDLEQVGRLADYLKEVRAVSERRSRWRTKSVAGYRLEWEAEIIKDEPGCIIGWRSLPGSEVKTSGSVTFFEEDGGTNVTLTMKYHLPAGAVGDALLRLLAESPERQAHRMLSRFKASVEETHERDAQRKAASVVDEASMDSFPASDPPSWTP